jgi:hypothetical protein
MARRRRMPTLRGSGVVVEIQQHANTSESISGDEVCHTFPSLWVPSSSSGSYLLCDILVGSRFGSLGDYFIRVAVLLGFVDLSVFMC